MSIWSDAAEEEVNAADTLDLGFIFDTFGFEVGGVPVEDVDVGGVDVYVREEVLVHECVVAFGVFSGDANIFILRNIRNY